MTELRTLLVHLDASPRCIERLRLAHALAGGLGAQVTGMYGVMPSFLLAPYGYGESLAAAMPLLESLDAERRGATRRLFERERGDAGSALNWADLGSEPVLTGLANQALYADLLVLGQYDAGDALVAGVPPDLVPSVLVTSGKPALVLPYVGDFTSIGQNVLVAWKPGREAARAVASALPLLRKARSVHLAVAEGADGDDTPGARCEGHLDLPGWLRRQGVAVELQHHAVAADHSGEGLLSLAADVDADLLVMGCYGHSRARELVLGGATRTVLRSMTLPVWMSH